MNIQEIAGLIKCLKNHDKTVLVAIEGYGGSGKSTLAEELKKLLSISDVIKIDSFIIKDKAQDAIPWEDVFDRKRLEKQVLQPASSSNSINYQRLDWEKNELGPIIKLPKLDYLIIDGISSFHPDVEHYYNLKIWVDTSIDIAKNRGLARDKGNENESLWERWAECDLSYQEKYHPEKRADAIVENN